MNFAHLDHCAPAPPLFTLLHSKTSLLGRQKPTFCNEVGKKCSGGLTLRIGSADDKYQCLKQCKERADGKCLWFSYDSKKKFCYQHDKCPKLLNLTVYEHFVSGEKTCPIFECNRPGLCVVRYLYA